MPSAAPLCSQCMNEVSLGTDSNAAIQVQGLGFVFWGRVEWRGSEGRYVLRGAAPRCKGS